MSNDIDKARESFKEFASQRGPHRIYDAEVLEVDNEAYTCTILINETTVYDVRLRAVISDNKSLDVLPAVGAAIVVGQLDENDFIMMAADLITSYRITIGTAQFEIDEAGILLKNEAETLNKILTDLVQGLLSVAAPKDVPGITLLLNRINNLLK